jgi:hypothetical protein
MKITFSILLLLVCAVSIAQPPEQETEKDSLEPYTRSYHLATDYNLQDQLVSQYANNGAMVRTFDERYEGIKGSPFLLNEFMPGVLIHTSGQSYENLQIRYNVLKQEVEYNNIGSSRTLVIGAHDLRLIILKDRLSKQDFIFEKRNINMQQGRAPQSPHFITLHDHGSTLLVQLEKTFIKADYKGAYSSDKKYDEYRTDFAYFLRPKNQDDFIRVRLNNASLLKALSDQKSALKDFIKAENLDIKIEGEAVKLLEFYDSL